MRDVKKDQNLYKISQFLKSVTSLLFLLNKYKIINVFESALSLHRFVSKNFSGLSYLLALRDYDTLLCMYKHNLFLQSVHTNVPENLFGMEFF